MTSPFSEMVRPSLMEEKYRELVSAVQGVWGTDAQVAPSLPKGLRYQYWKKCDKPRCRVHTNKHLGYNPESGWVTIGATNESAPMEHAQMINEKHMTPLPQYGWAGTGEGSELLRKDTRWNQILSKGGLIEFPRDQIIAYGWDKEPIVRQFRPDVLGVKRIECPYGCKNKDWAIDEEGADKAFKTHVKIVHPSVEGPAATAKALSESMEIFSKQLATDLATKSNGVDPAMIAAVVAATISALESNRAGNPVPVPAPPVTTEAKKRGRPPGGGKVPVVRRPAPRGKSLANVDVPVDMPVDVAEVNPAEDFIVG